MTNFIEEYLVGLGFQPDETSFKRFVDMVVQADREVSGHFGGMAKTILEAQGAIVGAFGSVSAAILGVVDKAAMADQGYRLLGLRMMMTTEQARKMDMITKALGVSLEEAVWDKELHARAQFLGHDMDRMTEALGKNFEKNMVGVRSYRMELSRLQMGVQFLGMAFASDLFEKMGGTGFLKQFNDWVSGLQKSIPQVADELSSYAIPVLKGTWAIFKGLGEVVKDAAIAFTDVIGLFSGDRSIESAAFSWKNLAAAILHVEHGLLAVVKAVTGAEMAVAHATAGLSAYLAGNSKVAQQEGKRAIGGIDEGSGIVLGLGALGTALGFQGLRGTYSFLSKILSFGIPGAASGAAAAAGGAAATGAAGATVGGAAAGGEAVAAVSMAGRVLPLLAAMLSRLGTVGMALGGAWAGTKLGEEGFDAFRESRWFPEWQEWKKQHVPLWLQHGAKGISSFLYGDDSTKKAPSAAAATTGAASGESSDVVTAIKDAAAKYNVPPAFALAIAKQESNLGKNASVSSAGAIGVMQLMPETAKGLDVDANDQQQNIEGGVKYLGQLLTRYHGDMAKAAAAYNAGPGRVDKSSGLGDLPAETRNYVPRVLQFTEGFERSIGEPAASGADTEHAPAWYSDQPSWFQDSPDWYKVPPAWMSGIVHPRPEQAPGTVLGSAAPGQSREAFAAAQSLSPAQHQGGVTANNTVNVSVGGVYVTNPGTDGNTIARQLAEKIRDEMLNRNLLDLPQVAPAW